MAQSGKVINWFKVYGEIVTVVGTAILAIAAVLTFLWIAKQTSSLQEQLILSQSVTRPYLYVGPSASKQLGKFTLKIENVGNIPARFILRDQEIWIDRKVKKRSGPISPVQNVLFPGKGVRSLSIQILRELKEDLRTGKRCLEMAMCIIYESTNSSDTRRWLGTAHYIFNPRKRLFDIMELDDREVSQSSEHCTVREPIGCD